MGKSVFIAEKPSVAQEFAKALHAQFSRKDGFLESEQYIVTWCYGHLVSMSYPEKYDETLKNTIAFGASPRATIALDKCAKINAWLSGRDFVTPEDVHAVVYDVLRHRIILSFEAQAGGLTSDDIIASLLKIVPLP